MHTLPLKDNHKFGGSKLDGLSEQPPHLSEPQLNLGATIYGLLYHSEIRQATLRHCQNACLHFERYNN